MQGCRLTEELADEDKEVEPRDQEMMEIGAEENQSEGVSGAAGHPLNKTQSSEMGKQKKDTDQNKKVPLNDNPRESGTTDGDQDEGQEMVAGSLR